MSHGLTFSDPPNHRRQWV